MAVEEDGSGRRRPAKLDPALASYFRNVGGSLDGDFESDEERSMFIAHALAALEGNALKICRDKVVSRIVERLLRCATTELLINFLSGTREKLSKFVCDKYASHVLQTALMLCLPLVGDEAVDEVVLPICEEISSKVENFLFDLYGSHVIRAVIQLLSGVGVGENLTQTSVSKVLPTEFKNHFKAFFKVLVNFPDFPRVLLHSTASPVLQTLLVASHHRLPKRCEKLCLQTLSSAQIDLLSDQDNESSVSTAAFCLVTDKVGSHAIETILSVCSSDLHRLFYSRCFKKRLFEMAMHPTANFVLQRLLETSHDKDEVTCMVEELSPQLEDILATGHAGVVVALVQACVETNSQQTAVFDALLHAFHTRSHVKYCARTFLSLRTLDSLVDCHDLDNIDSALAGKEVEVHYHGARLVQALLGFAESDRVAKSILRVGSVQLKSLACHSFGSRVLEAYFTCQSVAELRKRRLARSFQNQFVQLACDKFGSHVVDACWSISSLDFKQVIANELLSHEAALRANCFGRHVLVNCSIDEFKHRRHLWNEQQKANQKRKSALSDLLKDIGADTVDAPRAKKKKASSR